MILMITSAVSAKRKDPVKVIVYRKSPSAFGVKALSINLQKRLALQRLMRQLMHMNLYSA